MARITPAEYQATVEKIEKINARAAKRGLAGRITIEAERVEEEREIAAGLKVTEVKYDVTLGGEAPSYNGWALAAVLDFSEAGLIVNTAPGVESINREGLAAGNCAHCHMVRDRRKSYLVRNVETGQEIQVGSSCIKDFLGWSGHIAWINTDEERDDIEGGWGYAEPSYSVDTVLAVAWACIKVSGWKPASSYYSTTRGDVFTVLMPRAKMSDKERAFVDQIEALAATEDITARAAEVKAFILSDDFAGDSEYVRNLKVLMSADEISGRHFGLLVSAPQAYARHLEKTLIREKAAAQPQNFIGKEGDKIEITGTITGIRYIEGDYGTTVLYTIASEDGLVKWFASRDALGDKQGVEVHIKATVKKHEEWNGQKSTVVTRAKAL